MTEDNQTLDNVNDNLQISEENAETYEEIEASQDTDADNRGIDYAEVIKSDMRLLSQEFPELSSLTDICQLENPMRYAALRDLGLTPAEAYLATTKARRSYDNRSHLHPSPMVSSLKTSYMPEQDMEMARELFSGLSDAEIRRLYKRVTK